MQEFNFKQKLLWEEGYMSGSKNIETQTGLVHAMRSNGPLHQVCLLKVNQQFCSSHTYAICAISNRMKHEGAIAAPHNRFC